MDGVNWFKCALNANNNSNKTTEKMTSCGQSSDVAGIVVCIEKNNDEECRSLGACSAAWLKQMINM